MSIIGGYRQLVGVRMGGLSERGREVRTLDSRNQFVPCLETTAATGQRHGIVCLILSSVDIETAGDPPNTTVTLLIMVFHDDNCL